MNKFLPVLHNSHAQGHLRQFWLHGVHFSSIFCVRQSFKKENKSSTPWDTQEKGGKDFIPPPEYTSVGKVKCLWVK